jgi:hypothetical protein
MNDPDNFLSRWSRRKREAGVQKETDPPLETRESGEAATPRDGEEKRPDSLRSASPASSVSDFDAASLPSIETIRADTDISAFLQKGVPTTLRHAALRRAWSADPAIRDFIGPNENFWDAAGPDGIPGFGELDPNLDVKRLVSELFGENEPEKAKPETSEFANASGLAAEIAETPPQSEESQPQRIENVAAQQQVPAPATKQVAASATKLPRRHGGAMPE